MNSHLDLNAFNVAPGAQRHLPIAWVMLAIGVVALGASLYPLTHELNLLSGAKAAQTNMVKTLRREAVEQRKQMAEQTNTAALEREKIRSQIQESVQMSWDGIFDALEMAADTVHAGVSIISLAPTRVNGTSTHLNIAALAANAPIMLAYIEALKKDPRVLQVELSTQQPDEKVGPAVLRFRVSVVLNPKISVPHAVREPAAAVDAMANPLPPLAVVSSTPIHASSPIPSGKK
jgi:hypothetical protein